MHKNLRDTYKKYKELSSNPIDIKEYLKITSEYNKFLMDKIAKGKEVTLPQRMGTLCIIGKKQEVRFDENGKIKGLAPDWVKTKQLWEDNPTAKLEKKLVYHTNEHSDGMRYKYFWSKKRVLVKNKSLFSLRVTRTNKRVINQKIKQGQEF